MIARTNLRLLRSNREMSLRTLGKETGIPFGLLSEMERGMRLPTDAQLERICQALGVTSDLLYPSEQLRKALAE